MIIIGDYLFTYIAMLIYLFNHKGPKANYIHI